MDPSALHTTFVLHHRLGRGASATVWYAEHARTGLPVAVKILDAPAEGGSHDEGFRGEVESVCQLDHPAIIQVYDYGITSHGDPRVPAGRPWLAMELASAGTLHEVPEPWRWDTLRGLLLALLDALAHAHARGVVHRDLKPSNILLAGPDDASPGVKLTDFGIAWVRRDGQPTWRRAGTPRYMAPEQVRGTVHEVGPWTDLYALGCVAWELVTGAPPFAGRGAARLAHRHLYDPPPRLDARTPVPADLEAWLLRLLEKDPAARFRRAADAAWTLARLGPALLAPPPSPPAQRGEAADADANPATDLTLMDLLDGTLSEAPSPEGEPEAALTSAEPLPVLRPTLEGPLAEGWRPDPTPQRSLKGMTAGLSVFGLRRAPLVARLPEREALWRALTDATNAAAPRIVVLEGAAGVGKSALARWIGERAAELGVGSAFSVVHEPDSRADDAIVGALTRALGVHGLTTDELATALRHLLRRLADRPELLAAVVDGLAGTERLGAAATAALLEQLAEGRTLVVTVDDGAWAAGSLDLLRRALDRVSLPALIVVTVRDDALAERPDARRALGRLGGEWPTTHLTVEPLPLEDTRALIAAHLDLRGDLAQQVARRAAGNALLVEQLLGDWVARDLLRPTPTGFALPPGTPAPLPDALHAVWRARLDRLLEGELREARPALEVAAALGMDVSASAWRRTTAIAGVFHPPRLAGDLVRARLAVARPGGLRFAHPMLRESLERDAREAGRWTRWHDAAAEMLTRSRTPPDPARLGRHRLAAGAYDAALRALTDAAERALSDEDMDDAERLLADARAALSALDLPPHDLRDARFRLLEARLMRARDRLDAAAAAATAVAEDAQRHGWAHLHAEALAVRGEAARTRGDLPTASEAYAAALAAWEALDDVSGIAATCRAAALVAVQRGLTSEAEALLTRARALFERTHDAVGAASCVVGLGDIARTRRRHGEALDHYRAALATYQSANHRSGTANALHGVAEILRLFGRIDEAEAGYRQVIALDQALGRDDTIPRLNLVLCLVARDAWDAADQALDPLDAQWKAADRPGYRAFALAARLPGDAARARWSDLREHLTTLVALLAQSRVIDVDIASLVERAGAEASAMGQLDLGLMLLRLARDQWSALQAERALARVQAAIESLDGSDATLA